MFARVATWPTWLVLLGAGACNVPFGIDNLELREIGAAAGGASTAGAGGGGQTGGGDGGQAAPASSSASGGDGGGRNACGDGLINAGEQCDDGNTVGGDGCDSDCQVECGGMSMFHPASYHCYSLVANLDWFDARAKCAAGGPGWDLAALSTQAEHEWLVMALASWPDGAIWLGGNDLQVEGTFEWTNGEAWGFTAWAQGQPNGGGDCVHLVVDPANNPGWHDKDCPATQYALCELTPAGSP
jgi:cysteine-rich repeat protein